MHDERAILVYLSSSGGAALTVLRSAAETHTGYVRSTNQDLALVSGDLVAVADGMGGHLGGEVAARTAIEELLACFVQDRSGTGLVMAARRANRAVWRKSRVERTLHGMGTTLTAAALVEAGNGMKGDGDQGIHLALVNVGDSRAYLFDRTTNRLRQLTDDHSVVEEMVRQGELTPAEAATHPHRHVLTRALGIEPEVALDVWDLDAEVGYRFLLCSDGLTNELPDAEIAEILEGATSPEQAVGELVGRALGHGGMDNVTVVVADVVEGDDDPMSAPVQLVPPGPPAPEDPVVGTPELTEAIPITTPGSKPPSGPAAAGHREPATSSRVRETGHASGPDTQATFLADAMAPPANVDSPGAETGEIGPDRQGAPVDRKGVTSGPKHEKGRNVTVGHERSGPSLDGAIGADGPDSSGVRASSGGWSGEGGEQNTGGLHRRPVILVPRHQRTGHTDRILTPRVAVFIVILASLLVGTVGVVIWFDQSSYFVGLSGNSVAVYEGRPGGMLWFKPQLIEVSEVHTSDLLRSSIATLRGGVAESSLKAAEEIVDRLRNEKRNALAAATTTTTTTTTTTAPTTTTTTALANPPAGSG